MRDFHSLKVWQKSHELTRAIYSVSARFPAREVYGLTSQLRRAAVSVAANIAEGCGRGSDADFARFAQIAMGSASEVQYLLLLARDLSYFERDGVEGMEEKVEEVKRMLAGLLKRLRSAGEIDG